MRRAALVLAACVALAGCHKPAPRQIVAHPAPSAPQVRIAQAGETAIVPTVSASGTVAIRKAAAAAPGTPVAAEARSYVVKLALPAADAARVTLGAGAQVQFAIFENDTIVGRVIAVKDGAVEITLPNDSRLQAGQTGVARIVARGAATRVLAVPPSALIDRQGTAAQVYVVDLKTSLLHLRPVTLGEESPAGIAVTRGLRLGEWVALTRADTLHDGMKIEPLGPE